jgi:ubiquinone/menaquinone biosynthesis C-methylase UbiE
MMEHREERYWSRFAHTYDRDGEYVVGRPILRAIMKRLSEERDLGDAIDLGCGTGYLTRAITGKARHVFASDLSDQMLELARNRLSEYQNVTIQKAHCAHTGFPDDRFDTVLMANLIHVIDDPLSCLRESYRILRSGGHLLVIDFTGYRLHPFRKARLALRYARRWGVPPRSGRNDLSPEELARLVENAGFSIKNVELVEGECNAIYLRSSKCAKPLST